MSKKSIRTFRIASGLGIIVSGIIILSLFVSAGRDEANVQLSSLNTDMKYSVYPVNLPAELHFAGEKVPLEYFDVKEDLDKELLINVYWQSHAMLLIKRANRYFPIIENVLRKNGIPADMKYLAVAESDLTNSVSPDQAVGFWQFVDGTVRDYRLEVYDEGDVREDIFTGYVQSSLYFQILKNMVSMQEIKISTRLSRLMKLL